MYFSDITDKEWLVLAPFIAQGKMGPHINAIRYVMKRGCQWRLLPKEFPPWQTVYDYYLRCRKNGKRQEINDALVSQVREKVSKNPTPTLGIIDSQSVKNTQKGRLEDMTLVRKLKAENVT